MDASDKELREGNSEWPQRSGLCRLLPVVRRGLYHLTSICGLKGIRHKSYILPNNGEFPDTYTQSAKSFGRRYGYVSLFDFETPTEEQILAEYHKWEGFFYRHKPVTVLIGLDRRKLEPKLLPNETAKQTVGYGIPWMPHIEVWYPEPLPFSWATSCILVYPTEPLQYKVFELESTSKTKALDEVLDTL